MCDRTGFVPGFWPRRTDSSHQGSLAVTTYGSKARKWNRIDQDGFRRLKQLNVQAVCNSGTRFQIPGLARGHGPQAHPASQQGPDSGNHQAEGGEGQQGSTGAPRTGQTEIEEEKILV